ncbi:Arylsulfatase J [Lonchura striata]|uniref:Arylsulfatase J n=1 Tax=Lonchura striata TaxID=40157 RepID=A0A218UNB6_9PASE|nr:Arylsulfatase J [Lonchura striata domestica]
MVAAVLAGLSLLSLLTCGYLAWGSRRGGAGEAPGNPLGEEPVAGAPRSQPHIIFILADDQGFRDVGYHGSEIRTPTLDKLAAEGVKLENYYVQPMCTPSRSQLITGKKSCALRETLDVSLRLPWNNLGITGTYRYQIHTGLQHSIIRPTQPNCLPLDNVTLPQKLKEVGYSTHMVGKWHLGFYRRECMPTQRGFDSFFGSLLGSGDYYTHFKCDSPGICGYDLYENDNAAWDHDNGIYSTQMYTQKVQQILASHNPRKPIFLYIAYQAVHSPLQAPGRYFEHYRSINNINRRRYAAMLACLDEAINNVTLALRKYGYYENSIIIYSSDNGGQPMAGGSNWPLRGSKGTYWEGGIRAVGFVHSPLLKNKGSVCKELVHITDWFPTLITLAEGQIDEDIQLDGYDVWETISEGRRSPRVDILHNIDPIYTKAKNGSWAAGYGIWNTAIQSAIRAFSNAGPNRWHNERVSWSAGKTVWLFNITADPYERVDLSARHPEVVKQLLRRLSQFNKTAVPVRYPPKDPRSNPKLNGGKKIKKKKKANRKKGQSFHCRCPELPPFAVKHMTSERTPRVIYYRHEQKHITKVNAEWESLKVTSARQNSGSVLCVLNKCATRGDERGRLYGCEAQPDMQTLEHKGTLRFSVYNVFAEECRRIKRKRKEKAKEISEERAIPLLIIDVHYNPVLEEVPVGFQYITLPDEHRFLLSSAFKASECSSVTLRQSKRITKNINTDDHMKGDIIKYLDLN